MDEQLAEARPRQGLTYRQGNRIANVHAVRGDTVYWATYTDGREDPDGLYRCSLAEWEKLAAKAAARGASVFTLIRADVPNGGELLAPSPAAPKE